jgi:hypothetical protein
MLVVFAQLPGPGLVWSGAAASDQPIAAAQDGLPERVLPPGVRPPASPQGATSLLAGTVKDPAGTLVVLKCFTSPASVSTNAQLYLVQKLEVIV